MIKKTIGQASKSRFTSAALVALFLVGGATFAGAQEVIIPRMSREINERAEQHADPGTYGSSDSGAMHVFNAFFLDGGTLTLIPEPSTWVMTIVGASLLLSVQRFRRKKN